MSKRYYWLKLKNDFFNQREIKKLRRIAGGDTFTIIYLKMQLLSIQSEGVLKFEGTEESLSEQLALELDEDEDNIKLTLAFLSQNNLIEQISDSEFLMPQATQSLGSEVDSAERVRRHRDKKALQCNIDVTKSNTEIENRDKRLELENKDREREKNDTPTDTVSDTPPKPGRHKYGEYSNVLLSDDEYEKLMVEIPYSAAMIERLSEYIASTGKKYKSHYATIRAWHRRDSEKQQGDKAEKNMTGTSFNDIDF
jgi:predicted phage replisome organizer